MTKTTVWRVWDNYDGAPTLFKTRKNAENYCWNICGPDKSSWPTVDSTTLASINRKPAKMYIAIAWWPDHTYEKPPTDPSVNIAYADEPHVWDKKATKYRGEGDTKAIAIAHAKRTARQHPPRYVGGQSSNTSSGPLKVFTRHD